MSTPVVLIQDRTLRPIAGPVAVTSLRADQAFNAAASGQFVAPASSALLAAVYTPDARVAVIHAGAVWSSGPIEKAPAYQYSAAGGPGAPPGQVTVTWATNEAYLGERVCYPDPAHGSSVQTTDYWTATAVNAETVMRSLVDANVGPGALTYRQLPKLALGTVAAVGLPVTVTVRFEVLSDALRRIALAGAVYGSGGLGFRIREASGRLLFEVYQPADRTKSIRFSPQVGNLRELATDPEAPTVTAAIVGGDGTGAARVITERTPASMRDWRRIEKFVNSSDLTTAAYDGDQALLAGAETMGLSAQTIDTTQVVYGRDYALGDRVSVEAIPGTAVADIVTGAQLTYSPADGVLVTATVGSGGQLAAGAQTTLIRDLASRLSRQERF